MDGDDTRAAAPLDPFRRMSEVQVGHAGGDALIAVALASTLFFSVPLGEARDKAALYLLLTMTPYALLSPVVGPMLDRWRDSYRIAIVVAAIGRAVLALLLSTRTDRLALYPLAFGALVLSRTHGVSRAGLIPSVVPPGRTLLWANGRLAVVSVAGGAALALPGAALQHLFGPGLTLRLAAGAFAFSAARALGLPRGREGPRRREVLPDAHRELEPHLLAAGSAAAALRATVGFLIFFLAFSMRAQGEPSAAFAGLAVAAAAGGVAGSVAAQRVKQLVRGAWLLLSALAGLAATAVAVSSGRGFAPAAILAGLAALCAAAGRLGFDALLQRDAPPEVRGRAFARYETIFQLAWVGGAFLATLVPFGPGTGARAAAAICMVGVILGAGGWVRPGRTA